MIVAELLEDGEPVASWVFADPQLGLAWIWRKAEEMPEGSGGLSGRIDGHEVTL